MAQEWISPRLSEQRITQLAIHQIDATCMTALPVGKDLKKSNNPREKFDYDELLPDLAI